MSQINIISSALLFAMLAGSSQIAFADEPHLAEVAHLSLRLRWKNGRILVEQMSRGSHRERVDPKTGLPTGVPANQVRRFDDRGRFSAQVMVDGRAFGDPSRFDFPLLAEADAGNAEDVDAQVRKHITSEATVLLPLPPTNVAASVQISDDKTKHDYRAVVPTPLSDSDTAATTMTTTIAAPPISPSLPPSTKTSAPLSSTPTSKQTSTQIGRKPLRLDPSPTSPPAGPHDSNSQAHPVWHPASAPDAGLLLPHRQ